MQRTIRNLCMRTTMTVLALLCCLTGARAVEVLVGSVDANNSSESPIYPMHSEWNYSYTQQVFSAPEMGETKGTIKSITLWLAGNEDLPAMDFDIYMKEVNKENFRSFSDFELLAETDKVYTGTLTVHNTSMQAYTFQLTTPFEYSGTRSLLVAFNKRSGKWAGLHGRVFEIDDVLRSVGAYRNNYGAYNPASTINTDYISQINNGRNVIRFNITKPAEPVTSTSVLLSNHQSDYTYNSQFIPISSSATYSYTQQIYTAEEIGTFGTIKSFKMWLKGSTYTSILIDIYMKEVDREEWYNNQQETNWESMSGSDRVYRGTLTFNNSTGTAYTFQLEKPFNYSGTKNLLIAFNKREDSRNELEGKTFNRGDTKRRTLYAYRNMDGAYDPVDLTDPANPNSKVGGHTTADRNVIEFEILPSDEATIGPYNSATLYIPTDPEYKYSLTQQIYTKEELGTAATFQSIAFRSGSNSSSYTRNLDVYMVNTSKKSFSSTDDWETVTKGDLVFSGQVTFVPKAWTTLQLDTPFEYDGKANVVLAVDDNTGNESGRYSFTTYAASNLTLCYHDNSNNPDPASPPTGEVKSYKNQIRLVKSKAPAAMKPQHLRVTELTPFSAVVCWEGEGEAFNLLWGVYGSSTTITGGISGNDEGVCWVLDNLIPNTTYAFQVQSIVGNDRSEWVSVTFTTKEFILGDVNGDGSVTPADAIMILYKYFGVDQKGFIDAAADVNGDKNISPADAIEALYIYFGVGNNARALRPREDGLEPE